MKDSFRDGSGGWRELIEGQFPGRFRRQTRYAMQKNRDGFDTDRLKRFAGQLPAGFSLRPVDKNWFERLKEGEWSKDFVSQFSDYEQYSRCGGGFLAVEEKTKRSAGPPLTSFTGTGWKSRWTQKRDTAVWDWPGPAAPG